MLYEIPMHTGNRPPLWERGIGSIPVRLTDGTAAGLPVLAGANVLTVGVTGTGKTRSYTLPAARSLLSADPRMRGVFFETKRTFLDAFLRPEDKVITYASSAVPSGNLFRWCLIREIRRKKREKEKDFAPEIAWLQRLQKEQQSRLAAQVREETALLLQLDKRLERLEEDFPD